MAGKPAAIVFEKLAPADHDFPASLARTLEALGWVVARCPAGIGGADFARQAEAFAKSQTTPVVFSINYHDGLARWCAELGLRYVAWSEVYPMDLSGLRPLPPNADVWVFESTIEVAERMASIGANARFFPLGFDPKVFHPSDVARDIDLSFVGNGLDHMHQHFSDLAHKLAGAIADASGDPVRAQTMGLLARHVSNAGHMSLPEIEAIGGDPKVLEDRVLESCDAPDALVGAIRSSMARFRGLLRGYFARVQRSATLAEVAKVAEPTVFGRGWDDTPMSPHCQGPLPYHGTADVFRRSKINLHLHRIYMTGFNDRMINVPACGGLLISRRTPELERVLEVDAEVVVYDTAEDLVDKVRHYIEHPEQAARIAAAGQRRAHESFTFECRLTELLALAGLPAEKRAA